MAGAAGRFGQGFTAMATHGRGLRIGWMLALALWATGSLFAQLTITPNPPVPPQGTRGVPYAGLNFNVSGGSGTLTFTVSAGTLPPGLTPINPTTGAITGTPTEAGSFPFQITVTDSTTPTPQTATTGDITIVVVNPALQIISPAAGALAAGTVGTTYNVPLLAGGGDGLNYNWTVPPGSLPPGLNLTPTSGASIAISGTPALGSQGTYNFTVQVDDGDLATAPASQAYSIVINEAPAPTLTALTPNTAPRSVTGSLNVPLTVTGTGFLPGSVVVFDGQNLTTNFVSATSLTATIPASSLTVPAGTITVTVVNPDTKVSNGLGFVLTNANLVITTPATLPGGAFGVPYSTPISAEGGDGAFNWALAAGSSYPPGLSLASTSGATVNLTGSPTEVGTFTFTLNVDDGDANTTGASRGFSITIAPPPPPTVSSVSPTSANANSGGPVTITVTGTNFRSGAVVVFDGNDLSTTFVSPTQLTAQIPAGAPSGQFPIQVRNPAPNGVLSAESVMFTLFAPPALTVLNPASAIVGSGNTALTVTGENFRDGAVIRFNGTELTPTAFVNATTLTATIPAALLAGPVVAPQLLNVTVINPGGPPVSNALTFSLQPAPPGPVITSLIPDTVVVGRTDPLLLTVNGQNFDDTADIVFGGVALATTRLNVGSPIVTLTATVPPSAFVAVADIPVKVAMAGNVESPAVIFKVRLPAPSITAINPTTTVAATTPITVTVTGTNFQEGAVVRAGVTPLATTFVSATSLTATLTANTPGTLTMSVRNPDEQVSNGVPLVVEAPPPLLVLMTPTSATAGSGSVLLTLTGAGFVNGSAVLFGGAPPITATFVNSERITVTIPASLLTSAGTVNVIVRNPDGKQSGSLPFTVNPGAPPPSLLNLSPSQAPQGSGDTVMVVTGTDFSPNARVLFRTGELVPNPATATSTTLTVTIPASLLAAAGVVPVLVRNPDGAISNSVSFTVQAGTSAPTVSVLNPSSTQAGATGLVLSATGTNFQPGAVLLFGDSPLVSTVTGGTQISASVPPVLVQQAGSVNVSVRNPDGQTSNALVFGILGDGPPPVLTVLTPNAIAAGSGNTVLVLTGTNFSSGAVVLFGTATLIPSAATATSLTVTIPATQLTVAGTVAVLVRNADAQQSASLPFEIVGDSALTITTAPDLGVGIRGTAFQRQLQALGGTPPYTWSLSAGSTLPPGLNLNPGTGLLSGIPTQNGQYTFTLQVADSATGASQATRQREFRLEVRDFLVSTTSLPAARIGVPYSAQLQFTGGPTAAPADYRWVLLSAANSLPPGITLNTATGILGGTPTAVAGAFANFPFEVTVEHIPTGLRAPARSLQITVAGETLEISVQSLPIAAVGQAYGPDGAGVTIQALGGVSPYTIDIAANSLSLLLNAGFQVARPNAGTPAAQALVRITGTPATSGEILVRIIARDGAGTELQRDLPLLVLPAQLRISPASLPPAAIGAPYQQTLTVEGLSPQELAPPAGQPVVAWALVNAPAGLSISPAGVLSGTFPSAGTLTFAVRATTALRSVTQSYLLEVSVIPPTITTTSLPPATVGTAYVATIEASGGTPGYTWQIGGIVLPAGLSFDAASVTTATLRITGTPQAGAESRTFTLAVRDAANQVASRAFTLAVTALPVPAIQFAPIANVAPREQREVRLTLANPFPQALTGTASVSFQPNATNNADDPNVRFVVGTDGGRNAIFRFEANSTTAVFPNASPQLLQTGTVAGTIRLRAVIDGNGPSREEELVIPRSAPVILEGITLQRNDQGFTLTLTGFSTPRDLTSAQVTFTATAGSNLQTTQLTVPLGTAATAWYNSDPGRVNGSAFRLTLPFTVQGGANPVQSVTVTLTNSVGVSNARSASF